MFSVLAISPTVPYDRVPHAGGQTFNYYMKKLNEYSDFDLRVLAMYRPEEKVYFDHDAYGINCACYPTQGSLLLNCRRVIEDIFGAFGKASNPMLSGYKCHTLLRACRRLKQSGYEPDVIILEWTNVVLLAKQVKEIFPNARIVASEHDVSFLGFQRKSERNSGNRRLKKKAEQIRGMELGSLSTCDMVMTQNYKDKNLLLENGVSEDKIFVLTPKYMDMRSVERKDINRDILFWGAMNREENVTAVKWFIEQVMLKLKDCCIRFVVAGNEPPESLKALESDRIHITGYVDKIAPLFAQSLCMVSPLLLGAGIKVKILEAMSAGIPILTNHIGIEGIPARDGIHYYHCEAPEDYEKAVRLLLNKQTDMRQMENEEKQLIADCFDLETSVARYAQMLRGLGLCNRESNL